MSSVSMETSDLHRALTGASKRPAVLVQGAWVDHSDWRFVAASHRAARYLSEPPRCGRPIA